MKFFNTVVYDDVYQGAGGIYFVSSEQADDKSGRLFTVRCYDPNERRITTAGTFCSIATKRYAIKMAKNCSIHGSEYAQNIHAKSDEQSAIDSSEGMSQ